MDRHFYYFWTDASLEGVGTVLEQLNDDGQRHPIAFASRQTNSAEKKYAPTELKVLHSYLLWSILKYTYWEDPVQFTQIIKPWLVPV